MLNLKDFGAVGDLSQDDSDALAHAIETAKGELIYVPTGQYRLDKPVSTTRPVNLLGEGSGSGPYSASNTECSQFYVNFRAGGTALTVTNLYSSTIRSLQFANPHPANRSTALRLIGPPGKTTANSVIEGCGFASVDTPIRLTRPAHLRIRDCYFQVWKTAGVYAETTPGVEGAPGWIENNYFAGVSDKDTTQGPCVLTECGYVTVARNALIGGTVGVRVHVRNHPAGSPRICQNWIENQAHWGVLVTAEPPVQPDRCAMLDVSGNEFSNLNYAEKLTAHIGVASNEPNDWISTIAIKDNILRSKLSGSQKFIWLATGRNVQIAGNLIECVGNGNPVGIQCTGGAGNAQLKGPISITDNQFLGGFTRRLVLAPPGTQFRTRDNYPPDPA